MSKYNCQCNKNKHKYANNALQKIGNSLYNHRKYFYIDIFLI